MKMQPKSPRQLGSLFTDIRDKVENSLATAVGVKLSTPNNQPADVAAPKPAAKPGVSMTTVGIIAAAGAAILLFLKRR